MVRRLSPRRAATALLEVEQPGEARILGLGLSTWADPATPARFELLVDDPGRYAVLFTRAGTETPRRVGVIAVEG